MKKYNAKKVDEKGEKKESEEKSKKNQKKDLQRGDRDGIIDGHSREGDRDIENWTVNTSIEDKEKKEESRRQEVVFR